MIKICNVCKRELPASKEYFFKESKLKDGLKGKCKECSGYRFTPHNKIFCKKCNCELPASDNYFQKDPHGKYGFKSICKICIKVVKKEQYDKTKILKGKPSQYWREGFKVCSKCNVEFPMTVEFFSLNKLGHLGFRSDCRKCEIIRYKEYRLKYRIILNKRAVNWRKFNTKRYQLIRQSFIENNPEYFKHYARTYKVNNRDKFILASKKFYHNNRQLCADRHKVYSQSNKGREVKRRLTQKRKALKKGLPATFTRSQWKECLEYFSNSCAYCGKQEVNLSQDHFVPLSKGGAYTLGNIIPVCKSCNSSKCDKEFEDWYSKQSYFDENRIKKIHTYLNRKKELPC